MGSSKFSRQEKQQVHESLIKWSSVLLDSEYNPTRELITKVINVMFGSGSLQNKIFKMYDLLGSAESSLAGVESDERKVEIISETFGESSGKFSKQKNRKRTYSQSKQD